MNPHVAIALGTMRTIMKEYNSGGSFARQLSDAKLVRQSATVIAQATDEDIMETMADLNWHTPDALRCDPAPPPTTAIATLPQRGHSPTPGPRTVRRVPV